MLPECFLLLFLKSNINLSSVHGFSLFRNCLTDKITFLQFPGVQSITDYHLLEIAKLFNLAHLDISKCNAITERGILYLTTHYKNRKKGRQNLLHLNVSHCPRISDSGFRAILTCFTTLLTLDMGYNEVSEANHIRLPELEKLNVALCYSTYSIDTFIDSIATNCTKLKELDISVRALPDTSPILHIFDKLHFVKKLTANISNKETIFLNASPELVLSRSVIKAIALEIPRSRGMAKYLSSIKCLELRNWTITPRDFWFIMQTCKCMKTLSLTIKDEKKETVLVSKSWYDRLHVASVTTDSSPGLSLSEDYNEEMKALSLKHLALAGNIPLGQLQAISQKISTLVSLELVDSDISGELVLELMERNYGLKKLKLVRCNNVGQYPFVAVHKFPRALSCLQVYGMSVSDESVRLLCDSSSSLSLTKLCIDHGELSDEAVKNMGKSMKKLQVVSFTKQPITVPAFKYFVKKRCKTLTKINISYCKSLLHSTENMEEVCEIMSQCVRLEKFIAESASSPSLSRSTFDSALCLLLYRCTYLSEIKMNIYLPYQYLKQSLKVETLLSEPSNLRILKLGALFFKPNNVHPSICLGNIKNLKP